MGLDRLTEVRGLHLNEVGDTPGLDMLHTPTDCGEACPNRVANTAVSCNGSAASEDLRSVGRIEPWAWTFAWGMEEGQRRGWTFAWAWPLGLASRLRGGKMRPRWMGASNGRDKVNVLHCALRMMSLGLYTRLDRGGVGLRGCGCLGCSVLVVGVSMG